MIMKDILRDIIQYTHSLGNIELIKIVGTNAETRIFSVSDDKSTIINGVLKATLSQFEGVFGMPNLNKLKTILGFDEYGENAIIDVIREDRDGVVVPVSIHFDSGGGDFVNDYRLMSKSLVEEVIKTVTFKGATWNLTFDPGVESIGKFKRQFQANSEHTVFSTKLDGSNLRVTFGDGGSHSGNFVFHSGLTGVMSKQLHWPTKQFLAIMDLPGQKTVHISDRGVIRITVDSGIADYEYLILASKQ